MSKVVIFNASPRKNGYNSKLLEQVAKGAESKGAEIIEFNLNDAGIRGCQSCFYCRTHDGCAINDYLKPKRLLMKQMPLYLVLQSTTIKLQVKQKFG